MAAPISKPGIRLKIEFLPVLMNLAFVAIFLYMLYSNTGDWSKGNANISDFFHVNLDWASLILYLVYGIGAWSAIIGIAGLVNYRILHLRLLNILSPILLVIMLVFLLIVVSMNVWNSVGGWISGLDEENGFIACMIATTGIFVLLILGIIGIKQLLANKPTFEWGSSGKSRLSLHPRISATTTFVSMVAGSLVILAAESYYQKMQIYWMDVIQIFTRYMDPSAPAFISWVATVIVTAVFGIIALIQHRLNVNSRAMLSWIGRTEFVLALVAANVTVITWFAIAFELSTGLGLWIFPTLSLSAASAGPLIPMIVAWKKWLASKPPRFKFIRRLARFNDLVKVVAIIALLFVPFWFVFYQPLLARIPNIYLPFQAKMVNSNGVDVPVEAGIVYPSFETQPPASREYLNLSGPWRFWTGNNQSSVYSFYPRTPVYIAKLSNGEQEPSFDDSNWSITNVPTAVSQFEGAVKYWGVSWFRRLVIVPDSFASKSITLMFDGVNYICDVWIDGHYVGYHEGGFTSFAFDVTQLMQPGQHLIAVRIDNPEWGKGPYQSEIIPDGCDYFNYGGIVRELYLEAAPPVNVARCDITETNFATTNHINGSVKFQLDLVINHDGKHAACNVSVSLYPLYFPNETALESRDTWLFANKSAGQIIVPNQVLPLSSVQGLDFTAFRFSISLPFVSYWSTKYPNLYSVMANVTADGITDQFCMQTGFRNFTTSRQDLLLNGAPLKLAGVSVHEQYPAPTGRSLNDNQRFWDLECINATRSNWWRGSYPFHPMMYIYSDRFGIACNEETPLFWTNETEMIQGFARNAFQSIWIEMLYRDYNRPSILMWVASDEPWADGAYLQFLQQSKAFLDTHDPNRILSFACASSQSWNNDFRDTPLRIVTPNCYGGTFDGVIGDWYNSSIADIKAYQENNPGGKPFVVLEFGYWRDGSNPSNQSRCFQESFKAFSENPEIQGFTWWLAFDYYGPNYYNSMGVYNMARTWYQPDTFAAMVSAYANYTSSNL